MKTESISVLTVDDHVLFRDGIRILLLENEQMHLAGEAASGEEAIVLAEQLQPDVILMDIQLPGINGIETARQIVRTSPHIAILMLTMFDDDHSIFAAMCAGARGYVLKGVTHDEMLQAIQITAHGGAIFSAGIAARMTSFFGQIQAINQQHIFPELSQREREVLALIAKGQSNENISHMMNVSLKTIQNHVSNILNKLQVADRTQAMLRAKNAGLI
jgi:DNA-binding NarL/FixJ family response regulator